MRYKKNIILLWLNAVLVKVSINYFLKIGFSKFHLQYNFVFFWWISYFTFFMHTKAIIEPPFIEVIFNLFFWKIQFLENFSLKYTVKLNLKSILFPNFFNVIIFILSIVFILFSRRIGKWALFINSLVFDVFYSISFFCWFFKNLNELVKRTKDVSFNCITHAAVWSFLLKFLFVRHPPFLSYFPKFSSCICSRIISFITKQMLYSASTINLNSF